LVRFQPGVQLAVEDRDGRGRRAVIAHHRFRGAPLRG
jgi:hypothetical protein